MKYKFANTKKDLFSYRWKLHGVIKTHERELWRGQAAQVWTGLDAGLWLAESDHVTLILSSDWLLYEVCTEDWNKGRLQSL